MRRTPNKRRTSNKRRTKISVKLIRATALNRGLTVSDPILLNRLHLYSPYFGKLTLNIPSKQKTTKRCKSFPGIVASASFAEAGEGTRKIGLAVLICKTCSQPLGVVWLIWINHQTVLSPAELLNKYQQTTSRFWAQKLPKFSMKKPVLETSSVFHLQRESRTRSHTSGHNQQFESSLNRVGLQRTTSPLAWKRVFWALSGLSLIW